VKSASSSPVSPTRGLASPDVREPTPRPGPPRDPPIPIDTPRPRPVPPDPPIPPSEPPR
jgi:hypothetical protein